MKNKEESIWNLLMVPTAYAMTALVIGIPLCWKVNVQNRYDQKYEENLNRIIEDHCPGCSKITEHDYNANHWGNGWSLSLGHITEMKKIRNEKMSEWEKEAKYLTRKQAINWASYKLGLEDNLK